MNLKSILKIFKLNESNISMIIGAIVIVIIGLLVVSYFRGLDTGDTLPTGANIEDQSKEGVHTVAIGETLWDIAEQYYEDGYKWTDIRDANNLPASGEISEGQELTIPEVTVQPTTVATATATASATPEATVEPTPSPEVTPTPIESPEPATEEVVEQPTANTTDTISGASYTVVRGDNLWNIAVRAYGDGFRWTEIASANGLMNPNIIHAGNQLTLPR